MTVSPGRAQTAANDVPDSSRAKWIDATRLVGAGVSVDGVLDEPVWDGAMFASDFTQKDPDEGAPATLRTEVAFVYDDVALYVGARMYAPNPAAIRAQVARRDNGGNSDRIIISIDSYHDKRTAYTFAVTAGGVRVDYYHPSDNERSRDYSFDPVWQARTTIDSAGWTAEMRIPFSQLRFNTADVQVWGVNVNRFIPGRNEDVYWVYIPKQETGWSSRFGDLRGISGIAPSRRVEVLPYATTNATVNPNRDLNDPFDDGRNLETNVGGDFKMGLGPALTLDATVNPDFGQVDADPSVVNLSAFEVFFPERRPFFTEGAQLLEGRGARFYRSRRIGELPSGSSPSGDFVDGPLAATIIGAAKVSGRLASGTSIGTLVALTGREYAKTFDAASGLEDRELVAPLTGFAVARVQQEFGASASTVGVTLTGVHRAMDQSSPLADSLNQTAVAGGVDWNLRFDRGMYELSGSAGLSYIRGSPEAILEEQKNSRRFFQRPDQDYVHMDPTRTSLSGYQASLNFSKNGGRHWLYSLRSSARSPGFEINDAGRLGSTDEILGSGRLRYRETQPGRLFRNYELSLSAFSRWNFGGVRQSGEIGVDATVELNNFWRATVDLEYQPGAQSDDLTRGGPLMTRATSWNVTSRLSGNRAANTSWRASTNYRRDALGGWSFSASAGIGLRPSTQMEFRIDPRVRWSVNKRQYVVTDSIVRPEIYDGRFIFGNISRAEISTQFRLNYSFTPDMSLELYAEPFVSSGQYVGFGELWLPETNDLRFYGTAGTAIDPVVDTTTGLVTSYLVTDNVYNMPDGTNQFAFENPNFNVLSLRSNVVLRWEWRPGSTLFLVWQQNKSSDGDPNSRVELGDFFNAIPGPGTNFFAIKVSYWIPVR
ncbi:MAG: DUF5916 domain-containing protein [Gemmatimonadales bacterium]